jgi:glycosyltransferase involved in cell wall biosynthesis
MTALSEHRARLSAPKANKGRLIFFNYLDTITPHRVGGLDTTARAFADVARAAGFEVVYVSYGWSPEEQTTTDHDVRVGSFQDALDVLDQLGHVIVSFYIERRNRIQFACFRRRNRKTLRFVFFVSVWNPDRIKRLLGITELLYPFNGGAYGASERLVNLARRFDRKASLLCPLTRSEAAAGSPPKAPDAPIRLSFAGRFDKRKGLMHAIDVMKATHAQIDCSCEISGYFWPNDPDEAEIRAAFAANPYIDVWETDVNEWSKATEQRLEAQLDAADVMLLPYKKLSSTVDTPLLVLEAMSKRCVVYMPERPRSLLQFLTPNPGCAAPQDDSPEAVARWIVALAADRPRLLAAQEGNATLHARRQAETRVKFEAILTGG